MGQSNPFYNILDSVLLLDLYKYTDVYLQSLKFRFTNAFAYDNIQSNTLSPSFLIEPIQQIVFELKVYDMQLNHIVAAELAACSKVHITIILNTMFHKY